jgi:single-strand DNA-binding protein
MANETVITICGNAVEDAELRFTASGAAVAAFRVASTPRTFNKQTNAWEDGTTLFLRVNAWREMAENIAATVTRGMAVVVQGRLKMREYEKDGQKRQSFEIEADDVAVSLRRATAVVTKAQRGQSGAQQGGGQQRHAPQQDPWASSSGQQGGWGAPQQGGYSDQNPPF